MEHAVGVWVAGVHVRVHLVYVGVSRSALGSQAVVPRVSESRRGQAVAAPDASVCGVEGSAVGEVRVRGGDTRAGLRWVTATPQGRRYGATLTLGVGGSFFPRSSRGKSAGFSVIAEGAGLAQST